MDMIFSTNIDTIYYKYIVNLHYTLADYYYYSLRSMCMCQKILAPSPKQRTKAPHADFFRCEIYFLSSTIVSAISDVYPSKDDSSDRPIRLIISRLACFRSKYFVFPSPTFDYLSLSSISVRTKSD